MKTIGVVQVYNLLNSAKLTKMDDSDKFLVIKIMRVLKPIATNYSDAVKDAQDKLKGSDFEEMQKKAQDFDKLSNEEKIALNKYFEKYQNDVEKCLKEEAEKENKLKVEKIKEDAFGKFIASNDFTIEQIMKLQDILVV